MDELERQEYEALRATIRERGSVRAVTFLVTLIAWAALDLALLVSAAQPLASLLPLMVLVAGFEVVFQLHLGVERVGRYLQVAYEERRQRAVVADSVAATPPVAGWETVAMAYGKAYPAAGSDGLFPRIFLLAILINVLSTLGPSPLFWPRMAVSTAIIVVAHAAFAARIGLARQRAGRQRDEDLSRFRTLLSSE